VGREPASFQDTVQAMGPRSEALRRSSADSDGLASRFSAGPRRRCIEHGRVALSELSEALMNLGQKRVEGASSQPGTSFITTDLNIIHDARFALSVSRVSNKPLSYLCCELLYCCW